MKFRKGRYRLVFVFPLMGIAVKFPIIRLAKTTIMLIGHIINLEFRHIYEEIFYPIDSGWGYKSHLFGGIIINFKEFIFFQKTKNPFLQPTYFSFFGLVNIQKAGKMCCLKSVDLWCQLYELTNGKLFADSHHFENPDNFCLDDGCLRILDYGNEKTHNIINQYGEKISKSFDPKYNWEERKKAEIAQRRTR